VRSLPVRRVLLGAVVLLLALIAWGVVSTLQARGDVVAARRVLTDLRDADGVSDDDLRHGLDRAAAHLDDARSTLRQPGPWVTARLPLLGRSTKAVDVTAHAATVVVRGSRSVLDVTAGDEPIVRGKRIDIDRLEAVRDALADASSDASAVAGELDRLRTGWTPPQVGSGVRDARREFSDAARGLGNAVDLVTVLQGLAGADGPRSILMLLENNAELRGTGGLVSVFAEMTATDGSLKVGKFRDIDEIADHRTKARPVPASPEFVDLYGRYLANTTLWKNANMSPDGPTTFGLVADLAELSMGRRPSAVVAIDVPTIAAILDATGPAKLPDGTELTSRNAQEQLLVKAYENVPDTREGQAERRKRLREAADAVVSRLLDGKAGTVPLAGALSRMAAGRHLMLWSDDADEQERLERSGAAGAVRAGSGDLAMVTVHNFGGGKFEGNKLDYYARREMSVRVHLDRERAVVERTFTLRNNAPESGLSGYVAGLEDPGQSRNFVLFALPRAARITGWAQDETVLPLNPRNENDYSVLSDFAALDPGESATWVLTYELPLQGGRYELRAVPQPLTADARIDVEVLPAERLDLRVRRGEERVDGVWSDDLTMSIDIVRAPWWRRAGSAVRRFWNEPIT
jgi:hypothetical protein